MLQVKQDVKKINQCQFYPLKFFFLCHKLRPLGYLLSQKHVSSVKKGISDSHSAHQISPKSSCLLTKDSVLVTISLDTEDENNVKENASLIVCFLQI